MTSPTTAPREGMLATSLDPLDGAVYTPKNILITGGSGFMYVLPVTSPVLPLKS
jgi:hypothetical protein